MSKHFTYQPPEDIAEEEFKALMKYAGGFMKQFQEHIAQQLESIKTYPIETGGGTFEFIPQFIAVAIARGKDD